MFEIKYTVLDFTIEFQTDSRVNANKTSALRGILGESLAMTNCIFDTENRNCSTCFFNEKCLGNCILNTKLKSRPYFLAEDFISPLIIECNDYREYYEAGDRLKFKLIVLQGTCVYIPYLIKAYEVAGMFIGIKNNLFTIYNVKNEFGDVVFDGENIYKEKIIISSLKDYVMARKRFLHDINKIEFVTPLRFKKNGKYCDNIDGEVLLTLILRRIESVSALEKDQMIHEKFDDTYKFKDMEMFWSESERYSNRQKQKMALGGIVGTVLIENVINDELKDYLIAGELLHIGKSTVFGLGKYMLF